MYSLPLQTPPTIFADPAGVMRCPNSKSISLQVFNAGVLYQLALGRNGVASFPGAEAWEPPAGQFLPPGLWTFDSDDFYGGVCHAIRFQLAVAGLVTPATVTASA